MSQEKEWDDMDPKEITILSRWFWVTVALAVGTFLYFWPQLAKADTTTMVYSDRQVTLRLMLKPCTEPAVLKFIDPKEQELYREAIFVWEGRTLLSCWREWENAVRTMDEEGDRINPDLPKEAFKRDSGA